MNIANRQPVILLLSDDSARHGLADTMLAAGYRLYCCESGQQACQFLVERQVDLVVIATDMPERAAFDSCRMLRRTSSANMYPIVMAGPETATGAVTVDAFDAGADDFVPLPTSSRALVARLNHHLESIKRLQAISSISANASSAELAMILQFLEAEAKTGRLVAKHQGCKGIITLYQGHMLHAEARGFLGVDALVEMISWPTSTATFVEDQSIVGDLSATRKMTDVITQAVGRVAEYRAARRRLPPLETIFTSGLRPLAADAPKIQRAIYEHALTGYTVEEMLLDPNLSTRETTVALLDLIEGHCLEAADPLFLDFTWNLFHAYRDANLIKRLRLIKQAAAALTFPLPIWEENEEAEDLEKSWARPRPPARRRKRYPNAAGRWQTPAPMLLVTGNQPSHATTLVTSLGMLHGVITQTEPASHGDLSGIRITRLELVEDQILDLVELPGVLDRPKLRWLDQHAAQFIGVILLTAEETEDENRLHLRLLRQLWARFKGLYYLVVPKVVNRDQKAFFKIDCRVCGHELPVNMDRSGETMTCPACHADLRVPDCLDHLGKTLGLPDDVPIMELGTTDPEPARDLLVLLCETIIASFESDREPAPEWANETWQL